jgi:hypothetical protein
VNWINWEGSGVCYFKVLYLPERPDRNLVTLIRVSSIKNLIKIKYVKEAARYPTQERRSEDNTPSHKFFFQSPHLREHQLAE